MKLVLRASPKGMLHHTRPTDSSSSLKSSSAEAARCCHSCNRSSDTCVALALPSSPAADADAAAAFSFFCAREWVGVHRSHTACTASQPLGLAPATSSPTNAHGHAHISQPARNTADTLCPPPSSPSSVHSTVAHFPCRSPLSCHSQVPCFYKSPAPAADAQGCPHCHPPTHLLSNPPTLPPHLLQCLQRLCQPQRLGCLLVCYATLWAALT